MRTKLLVMLALAVSVGMALGLSPFASPDPDGLEKVAMEQGFADDGRLAAVQERAPVTDYAFPGVEDERLATGLAGFVGTLAVFAVGAGLTLVLRRRDEVRDDPTATA